MSEIEI